MTNPTMLLPVELSQSGVMRARLELDAIEQLLTAGGATAAKTPVASPVSSGSAMPDVVVLYEHARGNPKSRTPRMLELFANEPLMTPAEIASAMSNGEPLSKAQGRAFLRNVLRMEGHLVEKGRMRGTVIRKNFDGYDNEGAGRFGLTDEAKAALAAHLGL